MPSRLNSLFSSEFAKSIEMVAFYIVNHLLLSAVFNVSMSNVTACTIESNSSKEASAFLFP